MTAPHNPSSFKKSAAVGGEQESGFEQAFSSLAYAYLKDKAPRLIDYIVGFQLVDRNNDNTKAVGVFGFKVGSQWLYAPVFFLNGDLKGHELLYTKSQDAFVPMKENWVNYIMSRKPHVLGEGSPQDTHELGGLDPQLSQITFPPNFSKAGEDGFHAAVREGFARGCARIDDWAEPGLRMMAAGHLKRARFLYSAAGPEHRISLEKVAEDPFGAAMDGVNLSLEEFLGTNIHILKQAHYLYNTSATFRHGFERFHGGENIFRRVATTMRDTIKAAQDNIMPVAPVREKTAEELTSSIIPTAPSSSEIKPVDPAGKVSVWSKQAAMSPRGFARLDQAQREKIAKHGYLIEDERTGEEVSVPYKTQTLNKLQNPGETDLYSVLETPGSFSKMLIIHAPYTNAGKGDSCTAIRMEGDSGKRAFINAHATALWVDQAEDEDQPNRFKDWFDARDNGSLKKGGTFVAITPSGAGTRPFRVREVYEDGEAYKVNFEDYTSYNHDRVKGLPPVKDPDIYSDADHISTYDAKLNINRHNGTELRIANGELFVPPEAKFVQIKPPPKPRKTDSIMEDSPGEYYEEPCENDKAQSEDRPIEPGKIADVHMLFMKKTAEMKLYGDHSEVTIRTEKRGHERMPWQQALFCLVRDHGLTEKSASELLKQAQVKDAVTVRVKYAFQYPLQDQGPSAPAFPGPERGTEPVGYGSVNSIYPQEELMPVDGMQASQTDPSIYDPFIMPDQGAVGVAQQAAQKGQKEVFDTAIISGMLKAVRQDSLVDRYLGDLMKALDRLGRILFLYYWHGEEFEDRYGKADLIELEDSLRNAFEGLGDVVLFLKEKTIEAPSANEGSPDIAETARN